MIIVNPSTSITIVMSRGCSIWLILNTTLPGKVTHINVPMLSILSNRAIRIVSKTYSGRFSFAHICMTIFFRCFHKSLLRIIVLPLNLAGNCGGTQRSPLQPPPVASKPSGRINEGRIGSGKDCGDIRVFGLISLPAKDELNPFLHTLYIISIELYCPS